MESNKELNDQIKIKKAHFKMKYEVIISSGEKKQKDCVFIAVCCKTGF